MKYHVPILVVALFLSTSAWAEIYVPPRNVRDLAAGEKAGGVDYSLPLIYLEPHDFCYDLAKPIEVTISVVNLSDEQRTIDWRNIVGSLLLEAIGPGKVTPAIRRKDLPAPAVLTPKSLAQITIELRDSFKIEGASVYQLTYARPLEDGRIHVATPTRFVIEDDAAIDKLATVMEPGPARDTFASLLKDNPVFAAGGELKTFGWDAFDWPNEPRMKRVHWDEALTAATRGWGTGIDGLSGPGPRGGRDRALEAVIDRLLLLSDGFRAEPAPGVALGPDVNFRNNLPAAECERLHLKLLRSRSQAVVRRSINQLMMLRSEGALDDLFRIGDGSNRALAEEAIGSLSSYPDSSRITQYLRRKMTDADHGLALKAAIVTCHSGDSSGGAIVVRCLTSTDSVLRLAAIAQVGDSGHFLAYREKIITALLEELKKPMSDAHLERAIESLGAYPSDVVLKAVTPFEKHANTAIAGRARLSVNSIQHGLKR